MQSSRRHFISLLAGLSLTCTLQFARAADAPPAAPVVPALPHVLLKTTMGDIVLELNPEKAPNTVANFLSYVKSGFYKGTIFHRVIDGFMIQGGGFDKDMKQKPVKAPIKNEADNGLKNERYSLAMARMPAPHSASSQFFINVNDNVPLDYPGQDGWGYCVFGKVVEGMDVVDKIRQVPTGPSGMFQDVPVKPVIITAATLQK